MLAAALTLASWVAPTAAQEPGGAAALPKQLANPIASLMIGFNVAPVLENVIASWFQRLPR